MLLPFLLTVRAVDDIALFAVDEIMCGTLEFPFFIQEG